MINGEWTVYLSGEIHTDWRPKIADGIDKADFPVALLGPVTDHDASDDCGAVLAVAETPDQVVKLSAYVIDGTL